LSSWPLLSRRVAFLPGIYSGGGSPNRKAGREEKKHGQPSPTLVSPFELPEPSSRGSSAARGSLGKKGRLISRVVFQMNTAFILYNLDYVLWQKKGSFFKRRQDCSKGGKHGGSTSP